MCSSSTAVDPGRDAAKRPAKMFVSYAHADMRLADALLGPLRQHLMNSKNFVWDCWRDDWKIVIGEDWDREIQRAVGACDCGLLLLSPAFLTSQYIQQCELQNLLREGKLILPVGLTMLDFAVHDLRGLEKRQIFHLPIGPNGQRRAFSELVSPQQKERFTLKLFCNIERRMQRIMH